MLLGLSELLWFLLSELFLVFGRVFWHYIENGRNMEAVEVVEDMAWVQLIWIKMKIGEGEEHRKSWFSLLWYISLFCIFIVRRDFFCDFLGAIERLQFWLAQRYCTGYSRIIPLIFFHFFIFHFIMFSYLFFFFQFYVNIVFWFLDFIHYWKKCMNVAYMNDNEYEMLLILNDYFFI